MLDNLLTHDDMQACSILRYARSPQCSHPFLQSVFFELSVPGNDEVDVHHIVYEDFFSALGSLAGRQRWLLFILNHVLQHGSTYMKTQ